MLKEVVKILKDIEEGRIKKSGTLGTVDYYIIEKTSYSFHFYATYYRKNKKVLMEMLYDLRYKRYFIKRNGRELKFNVTNLDTVVPRHNESNIKKFFDMVSVEENRGMYIAMVDAIGSIGGELVAMPSRALIRLITEYNKLELVYKAGINVGVVRIQKIHSMIKEAGREDKIKVHQIFGLTRAQLKFAMANLSPTEKRERPTKVGNILLGVKYLDQKAMDTFKGYNELVHELEEKYNIYGRKEVFHEVSGITNYIEAHKTKMRESKGSPYCYWNRDFFALVMQYDHPNPRKLLEYLLFECLLSQGLAFWAAIQVYRDYYNMCIELGYERFDRYPKYLKTYHDIVSRNLSQVRDELTSKEFAEATKKYSSLAEDIGEYRVVVPETSKDLVHEGNMLHHCVASYTQSVIEGRTNIVFLRDSKEPDTPLVTVEIRGYSIVQARGQSNRLPTSKEKDALRRYAKKKGLVVESFV